MNNENGFKSSKPGLPDGYALRHGCQMAWPDVLVRTCAHLDINDMDIIYHKGFDIKIPAVFTMSMYNIRRWKIRLSPEAAKNVSQIFYRLFTVKKTKNIFNFNISLS